MIFIHLVAVDTADFTSGTKDHTRLIRALRVSILECVVDTFSGIQDLLAKIYITLIRKFGPKELICNNINILFSRNNISKGEESNTHRRTSTSLVSVPRNCKDCVYDLCHILLFVQIDGLEKIMLRNTELVCTRKKMRNVFHLRNAIIRQPVLVL